MFLMKLTRFVSKAIHRSIGIGRALEDFDINPVCFENLVVRNLSDCFGLPEKDVLCLYKPVHWVLWNDPQCCEPVFYVESSDDNGRRFSCLRVRKWESEQDPHYALLWEVLNRYGETLTARCEKRGIPLEGPKYPATP